MNEEDRQKILRNLVVLVEQTNLDALIPVLLQKGVFTLEMGQKYMVSHIQQFFFVCVCVCDGNLQTLMALCWYLY
jgi:hypothetical protein